MDLGTAPRCRLTCSINSSHVANFVVGKGNTEGLSGISASNVDMLLEHHKKFISIRSVLDDLWALDVYRLVVC